MDKNTFEEKLNIKSENGVIDDKGNPYSHIKEEEEDNDGHAKEDEHAEGHSTYLSAATHIINTIMGAGILSLPVVFRYLGVILGILFVGAIAAVNAFSVSMLLRCKEMTKRNGYAMFAKIAYGAAGSLLVKLVIIINNVGMCCAYLRIFGETSRNLATVFAESDSFFVTNWHNYFYVLIIFIIMSTLIFKDNLNSLKSASGIGVAGISIFFCCLIIIFIYKFSQDLIPEFDSSILWPQGEPLDIISSLPTAFLAFVFQFNMFPIYFTLKKKTKEEMKKATNLAIMFCFVIYCITGTLGYYMYRNNLKDTILSALTLDVQTFKGNDNFLIVILVIINISFLMSSTMSIPLMFFSLKNNFINSIIFCRKKFGKKQVGNEEFNNVTNINIDGPDSLSTTSLRNQEKISLIMNVAEQTSKLSKMTKYVIIIILWAFIGVITILVPGLKIIFNLVGSTAANSISFILPNLFFIKLVSMGNYSYSKIVPWTLMIFGFIILVVCLVGEVLKLFQE